ncbi:MAG TPA: hypothetical protein VGM83_09285 [Devosiaceae bacterium]|jgi:hypothetical protein
MGNAIQVNFARPRRTSRFTVGRDATGHWIVCDVKGLVGGIFADRATAVHFALVESDYTPGDVCAAPDDAVLSLDTLFETASSDAPKRVAGKH